MDQICDYQQDRDEVVRVVGCWDQQRGPSGTAPIAVQSVVEGPGRVGGAAHERRRLRNTHIVSGLGVKKLLLNVCVALFTRCTGDLVCSGKAGGVN